MGLSSVEPKFSVFISFNKHNSIELYAHVSSSSRFMEILADHKIYYRLFGGLRWLHICAYTAYGLSERSGAKCMPIG